MRADGIPPQHGLRQTELQRLQEVVNRLESKLEALTARRKHGASRLQEAFTSLPTPEAGVTHPVAWRTLPPGQRWLRWKDLARWVDWLIDTYRFPPSAWATWWAAPGVCEELACLRAWHRELVDVVIAAQMPEKPWDPDAAVNWLRAERADRIGRARSHVEWHDALWRVAQRIAGVVVDQRPLLMRESEWTARAAGANVSDPVTDREREFTQWLRGQWETWIDAQSTQAAQRSV